MPCTGRTESEKQHNILRWSQNRRGYMVSLIYIEANQFCIETVGPEWVKGRRSVDAGVCRYALLYAPRVREGNEKKNALTAICKGVSFGGSRGSRTPDPLLVRQTLWTNWAMLPSEMLWTSSLSLKRIAKVGKKNISANIFCVFWKFFVDLARNCYICSVVHGDVLVLTASDIGR